MAYDIRSRMSLRILPERSIKIPFIVQASFGHEVSPFRDDAQFLKMTVNVRP